MKGIIMCTQGQVMNNHWHMLGKLIRQAPPSTPKEYTYLIANSHLSIDSQVLDFTF
jgi:hypothetical protein